jgi:hypothetical protein
VVPRLIGAIEKNGVAREGFLPQLESMLGAGSFDNGREDSRFQYMISCDCHLGQALARHWAELQASLGDEPDGVLRTDAAGAGKDSARLQHDITLQREAVRAQALDVLVRSLPESDVRRHAWLNTDSFSTVWVTVWPSEDAHLSNEEFAEVAARYMGFSSPACEVYAGEPIANTRQTLDRHGFRLSSLPLPGDGWRTQHDSLKWQLACDAKEMGAAVRPEVFGLFSACIPQHGRNRFDALPIRKRQGLVPDFHIRLQWDGRGPERALLLELKTLHFGTSTYPNSEASRCKAVARRADALPQQYAAKARKVDRDFCGTAVGQTGPVEARLRQFEPVKGLVFGAFGEASPDVHRLLSALSQVGSRRHWRSMDAVEMCGAAGALAWMMRRRWAMIAARENARLTLGRLEYIGRGAYAAARRRASADSSDVRARRASCWGMRGPVVKGGR